MLVTPAGTTKMSSSPVKLNVFVPAEAGPAIDTVRPAAVAKTSKIEPRRRVI
jgi:hypothetical protein